MKFKDLLNIINQAHLNVNSSKPYICGGIPRDKYMDKLTNINDLDITTGDISVNKLSLEVKKLLLNKYNLFHKYYDDGHSSIFLGNIKIDFSSNFNIPNIEKYLINKNIKNPSNLEKEFFSRDFTCNALALDTDLKNIIDVTRQGFKDINSKVLRTCLSPEITMTSNKNRVIRSIYLAAKLDFNIDKSIVTFVANNPNTIRISTIKGLTEKINSAFEINPEKTSWYLSAMNLWDKIPINDITYPSYIKYNAKK